MHSKLNEASIELCKFKRSLFGQTVKCSNITSITKNDEDPSELSSIFCNNYTRFFQIYRFHSTLTWKYLHSMTQCRSGFVQAIYIIIASEHNVFSNAVYSVLPIGFAHNKRGRGQRKKLPKFSTFRQSPLFVN